MLHILLFFVFVQDMKYRAIHIGLPLALALLGVAVFVYNKYPLLVLWHNLLFLIITFVGLYAYISLKERKFSNPFKSIGLGDFLFFVAVMPYFSTPNFILYFVSGMLFSIIVFLVIKSITKSNLVPLAGLLAIYMMLIRCVGYYVDLNFFEAKLI